MKIIFSNSVLSIIFKILFLLPLLLIIKIAKDFEFIGFYGGLILFFQSGMLFCFNRLFGFVIFKNDKIYVPNDLQIIKFFRLQHKFSIYIKDITAIEFAEEECDTIGRNTYGNKNGTAIFLKIYTNNNEVKRLYLYKFNFKTWKKIERDLLNINDKILVIRNAKSFKKHLKTGVWE